MANKERRERDYMVDIILATETRNQAEALVSEVIKHAHIKELGSRLRVAALAAAEVQSICENPIAWTESQNFPGASKKEFFSRVKTALRVGNEVLERMFGEHFSGIVKKMAQKLTYDVTI